MFYLWTLGGPSLWLDEAWEANYYAGVTEAPWYNRPMLYMAAVRLLVSAFGPGEFVLRLLPCLAGIATVVLTFRLGRRYLGGWGALAAAAMVALSPEFLFHSHQLKHYTLDALFACLLLLAYLSYERRRKIRSLVLYLCVAIVSFGFSFTSVFVIAALTVEEAIAGWRDPRRLVRFAAATTVAAAVFAGVWLGFHASALEDRHLRDYFAEGYAPLSEPAALPMWAARRTVDLLRNLVGTPSGVAAGVVLLAGALSLLQKGRAMLPRVFLATLLFVGAASAVRLYPYGESRLNLFLLPMIAILIAGALSAAAAGAPAGSGGRWVRGTALAGLLFLFFHPALSGARPYLTTGWRQEHIRDLVAHLARERRPDERIYVTHGAVPAFRYYWFRNGKGTTVEGLIEGKRFRFEPERHREQVESLAARHERLWCLYSHIPENEKVVLRGLFLEWYDPEETLRHREVRLDRLRRKERTPP